MSNTDEKVKHYKAYLYMYGSMIYQRVTATLKFSLKEAA